MWRNPFKDIKKRKYTIGAAVVVFIALVVLIISTRTLADAGNKLTDIPATVTIDNRTYTKENPMIILEIVPDLSMGELGYLVGGENNPVLAEDVATVQAGLSESEGNALFTKWTEPIRAFSRANWNEVFIDDTIKGYEDRNLFANAIYGNSCMSDKMRVVVVQAKNLTLVTDAAGDKLFYDSVTEMSYDPGMIYIHDRVHNNTVTTIYNEMAKYTSTYELGKNYETQSTYKFTDNGNANNLKGDVAFEIYLRSVKYKSTALVIDRNIDGVTSGDVEDNNVAKLALLATSIDQDTFVQMFAQMEQEDGSWTGYYEGYGLEVSGRVIAGKMEGMESTDEMTWDLFYEGTSVGTMQTIYAGYCTLHVPQWIKEQSTGETYEHVISEDKINWSVGNLFLFNSELTRRYFASGQFEHNHHDSEDESLWTWDVKVSHEWVGGTQSEYPFFNPIGNTIFREDGVHVKGKVMLYNGNNFMDMSFISGHANYTDYDYGNGTYATDFSQLEKDSEGMIKNSDVLEYILGGHPTYQTIQKLTVLEIDPAGESKYSSADPAQGLAMAKRILEYFGTTMDDIDETNYMDKVQVKSIASNGFIGLQDDLAVTYDLIIVTDYNTANGIKTDNVGLFSSMGETMRLNVAYEGREQTTALSGNDFTEKAYNKLLEYIDTGKPMVIAKSIYENENLSEDAAIVYRLSQSSLKATGKDISNIQCEPMNDGKIATILTYKPVPVVTSISDQFICKYNGDVIDTSNAFTVDTIQEFAFTGKLNNTYGLAEAYYLELSIDKDGNGLYTEQEDDETGYETIFRGQISVDGEGNFTTGNIEMPDELRGYIRWKAKISTDADFRLATSVEDAFVIRYEQMDQVNVLQIQPSDNVTFSMGAGSAFMTRFNAIRDVIGVNLSVDVMTIEEFEALYTDVEYNADQGDYEDSEKNKLKDYDMVVIGFADDFSDEDITNVAALNNLVDYAEKGNSVLFAHDTITFSAYSDSTVQNASNQKDPAQADYIAAYNLTARFRNMVGMDRYGVSTGESTGLRKQGFTNMYLMQWAQKWDESTSTAEKYPMYGAMSESDINGVIKTNAVTKLNSGQVTDYPYHIEDTITVAETHAQWYQLDLEAQSTTTKEDGTRDYAESAEDVVVWYTLSERNATISLADCTLIASMGGWTEGTAGSLNYVANTNSVQGDNGKVPTGGSYIKFVPSVNGKLYLTVLGDEQSDSKIPYYVVEENEGASLKKDSERGNNSKVIDKSVQAGKTYYIYGVNSSGSTQMRIASVDFVPNSGSDASITWDSRLKELLNGTAMGTMTGNPIESEFKESRSASAYYTLAGQDALNNYYIYSKGNITYSGAGHSSMNEEAELKLFVNTVVKALGSGNNPPEVTVENAVKTSTTSAVYEQYFRPSNAENVITFTPTDIDMGVGNGPFASGTVYWDVDGDGIYRANTDILLHEYGNGELRNRIQTTLVIDSEMLAQTYNGTTLEQAIREGTPTIGIMVRDKAGQAGYAYVKLMYRQYYYLN